MVARASPGGFRQHAPSFPSRLGAWLCLSLRIDGEPDTDVTVDPTSKVRCTALLLQRHSIPGFPESSGEMIRVVITIAGAVA